jgi:cell wall-associated NlpC family hydrolase
MTYSVTRQQIVDAALSLRGLRFVHQGRDRNGIDCVGLLYLVLKEVNYPNIIDYEGYRKSPPASLVYGILSQNFDEIAVADAKPGDIFLMRLPGSMKPKHASIYVSDLIDIPAGRVPAILHTYAIGAKGGVVIDNLSSWRSKIVTAFALKGVVD